MKKYILTVLISAFALGSCVNPDKIAEQINIKEFVGANIERGNTVSLLFDIENMSNKNIRVKEGKLSIAAGERTLIRADAGDIVLGKRSSETVKLQLKLNTPQVAHIALSGNKDILKNLTVSGMIKVRAGIAGKTFTFDQMPLELFMDKLGIDENTLLKEIK